MKDTKKLGLPLCFCLENFYKGRRSNRELFTGERKVGSKEVLIGGRFLYGIRDVKSHCWVITLGKCRLVIHSLSCFLYVIFCSYNCFIQSFIHWRLLFKSIFWFYLLSVLSCCRISKYGSTWIYWVIYLYCLSLIYISSSNHSSFKSVVC